MFNRKKYIKEYNKRYYAENKKELKLLNKKYKKTKKGKLVQKRYKESKKGKTSQRKHYQSEKGKQAEKNYVFNNPKKIKARSFIRSLLQISDFTRDVCCICGKENAEFHHENYDLPNFGYWFCKQHHNEIHRRT